MKRKIFFLILTMAVIFSATATASFWGGKDKGAHCRDGAEKGHMQCPIAGKFMMKTDFLLEHKDEIGLSGEQVTTMKELKLQMEKNSIRQKAEMKTFMLDLHNMLWNDKIDVEAGNAIIDKTFASASQSAKAFS